MTTPDERQPVFLECRPCGHTWIAAWLPMPVSDFARLMKRAACPKCAQRKQIYMYEPGRVPPAPAEPGKS